MHRHRLLALGCAAAIYGVAAACSESLPEGRACPALCPNQSIQIVDTTLDGLNALSLDTTITGYPLLGTEPELLIAGRGDSIDVRGIIRFDSMSVEYLNPSTDSNQVPTHAHAPYLRLVFDTLSYRPRGSSAPGPIIAVYDVDTVGADTSVGVLASLFRPDRLIGGPQPLTVGQDSIRIPLDSTKVEAHLVSDQTMRLGIRLIHTGLGPPDGRLDILGASSGTPPVFSFVPDSDSAQVKTITPKSTTPAYDSALAQRLLVYPLIVSGTAPPLGEHLDVGGVPARRIFMQFVLPTHIIDSSTVVRATVTLHLVPNGRIGFVGPPPDSMGVLAEGIVSTPAVTDPGHEAGFNAPTTIIGIDTSYYSSAYADSINIEFVRAAQHWKGRATDTVTRAIVLVGTDEGATPLIASFYPALPSVPFALRPHIHLAYIKTETFGLP